MILREAKRVIPILALAGALLGAQALTAQQPPAPRAGGSNRAAIGPPGARQNNSPDTPGVVDHPKTYLSEHLPE